MAGRLKASATQHAAATGNRLELQMVAAPRYQGADPLAAVGGRPGDERGGFRGEHRLVRGARAEKHAGTEIHQQDDRSLAFFLEKLVWGRPVRAVTRQSMLRTSSPGW